MPDAKGPGHAKLSGADAAAELRTFLIADVRGYTRFTQERGDEAAAIFASAFADIVEEMVVLRNGRVIELRGDEALAVFPSARQALRSAVELQARFAEEMRGDHSLPFRVGIGLDAGEAVPVKGGYRGGALNLAARLCSLAGPGEALASETLTNLARKTDGLDYVERGHVQLKGLADPVKVFQVVPSPPIHAITPGPAEMVDAMSEEQRFPIGGFLGSLPSGALADREEEIHRILVTVDAVVAGHGRLIMLAGEPGAGKTRLAQELTLNVRNRAFIIATGTCYESRQAVPHYPFLDALAMLYGAVPPTIRSEVPHRWPYLGRLLPEAGIQVRGVGDEGKEEQDRLFRAITGFVQAVAATAPVALLLDDLQWADTATLELLQHLARHTRAHRVLVVGTYRDVEVGRQHPLRRALRDLTREQLMERVPVRRLAPDGTAALMAVSLGDTEIASDLASWMHSHTEGNPFFIQELLRMLLERGDMYQEGGRWRSRKLEEIEVPETVRSVIEERLSRLSDEAQHMLPEASVLGQTFNFDHLHAIADRPEEELAAILEEATKAALIREIGRDTYEFNHALTRQALYVELTSHRKRKLHLAAAEALEARFRKESGAQRSGWAADLASHFIEADVPERALHYELLAADHAESLFAQSEAEKHYRRALQLIRRIYGPPEDAIGPGSRIEAEALFKLGRILFRGDKYDEALPLFERAAQLYRALGEPVLQGRAGTHIATMYGHKGLSQQETAVIRDVELLVDAMDETTIQSELVHLYGELAYLYFQTGNYNAGLRVAEQAVKVARELGDDQLLSQAEVRRAMTLGLLGRLEEAAQTAQSLIPRAEAAGDLYTLQRALHTAAETLMLMGEFEQSRELRERELAASERVGPTSGVGMTLHNLGQLALYRGDWQLARMYLERALDTLQAFGNVYHSIYPTLFLGKLAVQEGDWEEADRKLQQSIIIADRLGEVAAMRYAHRALAERDLLAGHPETAVARLETLLDRPGLQETDVTYLLPTLSWAHLELGEMSRAEQIVAEARARATTQQHRLALVDALRVQGMVLDRRRRRKEAQHAFQDAVLLARGMPHPYAEARALYEWGMMQSRERPSPRGRALLKEALVIFERLGARPYIQRTQQALAQLSRR